MSKRILFFITGTLLTLSAFGKVYLLRTNGVAALGGFLENSSIPMYWVLWGAVLIEFISAGFAFFAPSRKCAYLLFYLGVGFTAYRVTILAFNLQAPCSCLGDLPQLLGLGKGADYWLSWLVFAVYIVAAGTLVLLFNRGVRTGGTTARGAIRMNMKYVTSLFVAIILATFVGIQFYRSFMDVTASRQENPVAGVRDGEITAAQRALIDSILNIGKMKAHAERVPALEKILATAADEDFPLLFSAIMQAFGKDRRLFNEVFEIWSSKNPEAAVKWAFTTLEQGRERRLLMEKAGLKWAGIDFSAAFAWMLTLPDINSKWSLAALALEELAKTDPATAYKYLNELSSGRLRRVAAARVFEQWVIADPDVAFETMGAMVRGSDAYHNGLPVWGKVNPERASSWLLAYAEETGKPVTHLLAMAASENSESFANILYNGGAPYNSDHVEAIFGLESILTRWANKTPSAPSEVVSWLQAITDSDERDRITKRLLGSNFSDDGKRIYDWKLPLALSLTHEADRQSALIDIAKEWAFDDPEAALNWAAKTDNPLVQDAALQSSLGNIAKTDVSRAIDLLGEIQSEDIRHEAIKEIVSGWSSSDPAAATLWSMKELDPVEDHEVIVFSARAWAKKDSAQVIEWINNNEVDQIYAIPMLNTVVNENSPESAIELLRAVKDSARRDTAMATAASRWLLIDSEAARKWIPSSELGDKQKERLLSLPDTFFR